MTQTLTGSHIFQSLESILMATRTTDTIDDDVPLLSQEESDHEVVNTWSTRRYYGTTEMTNKAAPGPSTSIRVEHSDTEIGLCARLCACLSVCPCGPQGGSTEMAAAGPSTSIQVEHSDTQQSTSDTEIVQCECQKPVTEEDFRQLVQNMPRRTFQHILETCFDIPKDSLQKGERFYVPLHRWSQKLENQLTRSQLYNKLQKAKRLGLCSTTEWCEFLVPSTCIVKCQFTAENVERNHSCAECNTKVDPNTDLARISRNMPPRLWQHIVSECLEVSDAEIYIQEYKSGFKWLRNIIFDILYAWWKKVNPTRAQLYEKFTRAISLGICESTEWFEFLISPSCRIHFPVEERGIHDTERQQGIKLSKSKQLLVRLMENPLGLHFMLVSLFIKLNYGISHNIYPPLSLALSMCVFPLLIFRVPVSLEYCLSLEYVPKLNLMYLILAILNFLSMYMGESSYGSLIVTWIVQCVFIMSTPYATCIHTTKPCFSMTPNKEAVDKVWFVTQRDIVTVYGKYRPHCSALETFVNYMTWSYTGILMAYIIMYIWELNATTIRQLSVLSQIAIITMWLMTFNEKSFYSCRDVKMLSKALLSWIILSTPALIFIPVFFLVVWFSVLNHVDELVIVIDLIACSSLPPGPSELVTSCLVTLFIINLYRIFNFLPEEKRSWYQEYFTCTLMWWIISFVLTYKWSGGSGEFGRNLFFRLILVVLNPILPYEICLTKVSHTTTENTTVTQTMFNIASTSSINLTTISP